MDRTEHNLKTCPEEFQAVWDHRRPYEVRVFDRPYKTGDVLRLFEYLPDAPNFTGRYVRAEVTCITRPGLYGPGLYGLPEKIGVMGIRVLERREIDPTRARHWCQSGERYLPPTVSGDVCQK
jgi:uncharacterized protein DUF3850